MQVFQIVIRDGVEMRHLIMKEPKFNSQRWPVGHSDVYWMNNQSKEICVILGFLLQRGQFLPHPQQAHMHAHGCIYTHTHTLIPEFALDTMRKASYVNSI